MSPACCANSEKGQTLIFGPFKVSSKGWTGSRGTLLIVRNVFDICVTTSQRWPIQHWLCAFIPAHLTAECTCKLRGPLHLIETEVQDREWPVCSPVARHILCSLALFTLALELNVNQELRTG